MILANRGDWVYNVGASAKSGVGISSPQYIEAAKTPLHSVFFCGRNLPVRASRLGGVRARRSLCAVLLTRSARHPFEISGSLVANTLTYTETAIMATIPARLLPHIFVSNSRLVTTSIAISRCLEKRHDDVLKKIKSLDCSENFTARNFAESSYANTQNKKQPCYEITKDGFVFLAMGFTGKKAARFKELYINEFNRMEAQLKKPATQETLLLKFGDGPLLQAVAVSGVFIDGKQAESFNNALKTLRCATDWLEEVKAKCKL